MLNYRMLMMLQNFITHCGLCKLWGSMKMKLIVGNFMNFLLCNFYCILAVLRIISAVLLFGNIEFTSEKKSDQAILPHDKGLFDLCIKVCIEKIV